MSIIHEPNGAVFALWQGNQHPGIQRRNSNNTLCWNELASKNVVKSKGVYHKLFHWQCIDNEIDGMKYTELMAAGKAE